MRLEAFAFCSVIKVLPLNRDGACCATITTAIVDAASRRVKPNAGQGALRSPVLRAGAEVLRAGSVLASLHLSDRGCRY